MNGRSGGRQPILRRDAWLDQCLPKREIAKRLVRFSGHFLPSARRLPIVRTRVAIPGLCSSYTHTGERLGAFPKSRL